VTDEPLGEHVMGSQRLGEREGLAHKASYALAQGVVEAFNMGSFTTLLAYTAVSLLGKTRWYASQKSR
jgi:hypothetical protein